MRRIVFVSILVLVSFAFVFSSLDVTAANISSIVQKARTQKGSKTIICSPGGEKEGTVSLEEGMKELRSGMVLHLLPGYYNPKELIMIDQNNVIIEGDGSGGECHLPMVIYGKDCIVRNIHLRWLEAGDITVVDTKAWNITITNGGKKIEAVIFNSIARNLSIYADKSDITISESSILQSYLPKEGGEVDAAWRYNTSIHGSYYTIVGFGNMEKKGSLTFEKCILYSNSGLFSVPTNSKLIDITLDSNIISFKKALAMTKEKTVNDLKDLKDFFGVKLKGDNIVKEPIFLKTPDIKSHWQLNTDTLTLKDGSPGYGKGIGANMGPKNVPVPRVVEKK